MKSNSKHKAFALTKTRAAPLIAAALMALIALFGMTACPNNVEGGAVTGTANGGNTGGLKWHEAPLIEGGASLILSPDKLTIRVAVTTSDNSPITVEGCDKTELTSGTWTELKAKGTKVILKGKITELKVGEWNSNDSNKLTALNVQGCTALQTLGCNYNQLTELNLQGCTALEFLYCRNNQLTSLNTQGCTALQSLNCGDNKLTALNVQGCTALQGLNCGDNKLTALNVQGCTALQSLYCSSNQLTALNVQGVNALKDLYCSSNQLTALNVQGCTALQELLCSDNQLAADAFTKLFNDLPQRTVSQVVKCRLYTEQSDVTEGNHKDFTSPGELKTAFDNAKTVKNWKMYKYDTNGHDVKI